MRLRIAVVLAGLAVAAGCGTTKHAAQQTSTTAQPGTVTSAPPAAPAARFRAALSAPTHTPPVGSKKWWYVVRATTAQGEPLHARLTVEVVDPLGTAHVAEVGTSTRKLLNFPFAGRYARLPADVPRDREGAGELANPDLLGPPALSGVEVVLEGVRKTFEDGRIGALRDVSLRLQAGDFVALTGPSGSGKSTLLNLIGALDRPDAGSIVVGGEDVVRLQDQAGYRAAVVGFVFQLHNLIPTLSAAENVQVAMLGHGVRRRERERRAQVLLEEVGLSGRLDSSPTTISGGERQRVAIARALANEPRLLLADEPTGALDSETGGQIVRLLLRLRDQYRMTVLLVTNDESVSQQADRVLRLRDGNVEGNATRASTPRPA
jgi:putative ABC transport system ATP-binding protein